MNRARPGSQAILSILIGLSTAIICEPTHAIAPATDEQLLCSGSHVAEVAVESAQLEPGHCFLGDTASTCSCQGTLDLRVTRLLAIKDSVASYPVDPGIDVGRIVRVAWQHGVFPPVNDADVCAVESAKMRQSPTLASIFTHYGLYADGTRYLNPTPYPAHLWPIEREAWATKIMQDSRPADCAAPVRH